MRIVIASAGSTGDVAPYTGVAATLAGRGHDVVVTAARDVAHLVTAAGLAVAELPISARDQLDGFTPMPGLRGQLAGMQWLADKGKEQAEPIARALLEILRGADAVVLSPLMIVGMQLAEGLGIPSAGLYLQPMTPTRAYGPSALGLPSLGGPLNKAIGDWFLDTAARPHWPLVQRLRSELGLPAAPPPGRYRRESMREGWPLLHGFSRHVVRHEPDWPANVRTVGYCWPATDLSWRPEPALEAFLAAGPAPIVVSFGSAPFGDPAQARRTVVDAARRAGVRVVLQAGWARLDEAEGSYDDVLAVGHVPHDWLLPRAAAVVHHCGAGTTAAGLRAGIPAVAVPVMLDQPFWAKRLYGLGVAPPPIPAARLDVDRLATALTAVTTDPSYRDRAGELAALIATEDGNSAVADVIEMFGQAGRPDWISYIPD